MKNIKKILLFLGAVSLIIYGKTNADKLKDGSTGSEVKTVIEEKETVMTSKKEENTQQQGTPKSAEPATGPVSEEKNTTVTTPKTTAKSKTVIKKPVSTKGSETVKKGSFGRVR